MLLWKKKWNGSGILCGHRLTISVEILRVVSFWRRAFPAASLCKEFVKSHLTMFVILPSSLNANLHDNIS